MAPLCTNCNTLVLVLGLYGFKCLWQQVMLLKTMTFGTFDAVAFRGVGGGGFRSDRKSSDIDVDKWYDALLCSCILHHNHHSNADDH